MAKGQTTLTRTQTEPGAKDAAEAAAGTTASARRGGLLALVKASAVWAITIFLAINAILFYIDYKQQQSRKPGSSNELNLWNGTESIESMLDVYPRTARHPKVVLAGSSLIVIPNWAMDRAISAAVPDVFHHHYSQELEKELKAAGADKHQVLSIAAMGAMTSDLYLLSDRLLKGEGTPEYLVVGLAPRDFYDYDVPSPMATPAFRRLVELNNFPRYAGSFLPGWKDRVEWLAEHTCFFYGNRARLQRQVDKGVDKTYAFLKLPEDKKEGANAEGGGFKLNGSKEELFASSKKEYTRRYRGIEAKKLELQLGFLKDLGQLARERQFKLIVVNMPLSEENRSLMPDGFYERYRQMLEDSANASGARLIDLGQSPDFKRDDFLDTAHLNHLGGFKVYQSIVKAVKQ